MSFFPIACFLRPIFLTPVLFLTSLLSRFLFVLLLLVVSLPLFAADAWRSFAPVQAVLDGHSPQTSGLVLDLPLVSEDGSAVPLGVHFEGNLTAGDQLAEIRVFATANPNPEVIDFYFFDARALGEVETRIRLSESQTVIALARSQAGQVWVAEREVRVTVSGCLMPGDARMQAGMQNPRLALPRRIDPGLPVDVRTLVQHPMETGLRENAEGKPVPQKLVESLQLELDNEKVFQARFYTGTSANPYVRLQLKPQASSDLTLVWTDQEGKSVKAQEVIRLP